LPTFGRGRDYKMQKRKTFPHSYVAYKCEQKYGPWNKMECVINSMRLYYGKTTKKELDQKGEKYVVVSREEAIEWYKRQKGRR